MPSISIPGIKTQEIGTMISPGLIYLLLSTALFAVAVVIHFHANTLSVPISSAVTFLTAILPIIALMNAYMRPNLLLTAHEHAPPSFARHLPTALQTIQALLSAVLATLLLQSALPNSVLTRCALEDQWMRMFRGKDSNSLRAIQDALDCCGFNSVRDRAYPFGQPSTCPETYGRDRSCRDAWRGVLQTSAGVDFGVVVAVALLQLIGLLMMKEGSNWWTAWRICSSRRQPDLSTTEWQSRRRLLNGPFENVEEEQGEFGTEQREGRHYGTTAGEGPRVEPSTMREERSAWDD